LAGAVVLPYWAWYSRFGFLHVDVLIALFPLLGLVVVLAYPVGEVSAAVWVSGEWR
jgi:hypothetical protein